MPRKTKFQCNREQRLLNPAKKKSLREGKALWDSYISQYGKDGQDMHTKKAKKAKYDWPKGGGGGGRDFGLEERS